MEVAPIPKPKSKLPIVIAIVVVVAVVVIASVLWLVVFKKEEAAGPGPTATATFTMVLSIASQDDANNSVTWSVASVSRGDVKKDDISLELLKGGTGTNVGVMYQYEDADNNGYLSATDTFLVFAPEDGDYTLRVVYCPFASLESSVAFESQLTHY